MERIKNYIKTNIKHLKETTDMTIPYIMNNGLGMFLERECEVAFKKEKELCFFETINKHIEKDNFNKDEFYSMLNRYKELLSNNLLECKLHINSTSHILNLVRLWEFETQSTILKRIDTIEKLLKK